MQSVSLLIPAYNEESTIEKVVNEHLDLLLELESQNHIQEFEIIVLNDGSRDSTYSKAVSVSKRSKKIKVLTNDKPSGLQKAFHQLYMDAQFEWTILTPGDGQWPAEGVRRMIQAASEQNWESGVIGVRRDKSLVYTRYRRIISFLFRLFSFLVLREDLVDLGSIKLLPTKLNKFTYATSGPLQEIERIKFFRLINSKPLLLVDVPWVNREIGKASGASFKTLLTVLKDLLIVWKKTDV